MNFDKNCKKILIIGIITAIIILIITSVIGVYLAYNKIQKNPTISDSIKNIISSTTTIKSNSINKTSTTSTTIIPSTTTTTLNPFSNWNTLSTNDYNFKYPTDVSITSNNPQSNCGVFEESKASFTGPNQPQLPTELLDGYIFTILKECNSPTLSPQEWTQNQITNSLENTFDENIDISDVTSTQIDEIEAYQYSTISNYESFISKSSNTTLITNGTMYHLVIYIAGEESDVEEYENITEQILSTLSFSR